MSTHASGPAVNPLLAPWDTPHGLPPFHLIRAEHFEPAIEVAMAAHREELRAISGDPTPPDFHNTVAALDRAGRLLGRVMRAFGALAGSATSEDIQAVQRRVAAPLAAHANAEYLDPALFARIDAVHRARDTLGLAPEALRLLDRLHLDFVRSGARLEGAARERFAAINEELAALTTRFGQNVLHDESTWLLPLSGEADLAGLPGFVRDAAAQAAAERGAGAVHAITLSRSLVVPFLTFSTRRDLREQAWRAWTSRGEHAGEHDNRPLVAAILRLRHEQAALMGHASYADWRLEDTMAGTRAAVQRLLDEVWPRALVAAREEQAAIERAAREAGHEGPIEPWDWRFHAERVRHSAFAIDDAEVKPYFALESVAAAAFDCASRLFGLRFTRRHDLPAYHPDVHSYEVHDAAGRLVGVFQQDNFARPTKRSGAWMSQLRLQHRNLGAAAGPGETPLVMNNNNFARGAPGAPTLLSLDDARTLFHEFGHGLHGLLSSVTYERLSGTNVLRDFVELPSQLFEHWLLEPSVLKQHARHWQTGEPIPEALVARIHAARRFGQGYETVRYTASAIVDMVVHAFESPEVPEDLCAFEAELLGRLGLPRAVGQNHRLVHFQHLFAGSGYAAGYYVYLWAEVLDADGFDAFREAGDPFDAAVAERLRRFVYSSGGSLEPGAAFRAFRGRDPTVQPLLAKRGLVPEPAAA
jgi:peptidyl-dipeptidase Dcp